MSSSPHALTDELSDKEQSERSSRESIPHPPREQLTNSSPTIDKASDQDKPPVPSQMAGGVSNLDRSCPNASVGVLVAMTAGPMSSQQGTEAPKGIGKGPSKNDRLIKGNKHGGKGSMITGNFGPYPHGHPAIGGTVIENETKAEERRSVFVAGDVKRY